MCDFGGQLLSADPLNPSSPSRRERGSHAFAHISHSLPLPSHSPPAFGPSSISCFIHLFPNSSHYYFPYQIRRLFSCFSPLHYLSSLHTLPHQALSSSSFFCLPPSISHVPLSLAITELFPVNCKSLMHFILKAKKNVIIFRVYTFSL